MRWRRAKIQWLNLSHYELILVPPGRKGGSKGRKSWGGRKEGRRESGINKDVRKGVEKERSILFYTEKSLVLKGFDFVIAVQLVCPSV